MTAGAINDPDLVQAIDELQHVARRLVRLDELVTSIDLVEQYDRIAQMHAERADLRSQIRIRAEKLNLDARALLMLVTMANGMRTQRKHQLPTMEAVRNRIEIIRDAAERAQIEAEAEAKFARFVATDAKLRAKAGADAIAYLDASRS